MEWDVKLGGVSIKHQVASINLHKGRSLFCKELTLTLNDKDFLDQFDFTEIPAEPRIEIFTEVDGNWISEGTFFVEEPGTTQDKDKIVHTIYGRDISAQLTFPFATRISKEWPDETTLFEIIQEILEEAGLEYDASRMMINDYTIYPSTYSVTYRYPLEIIQELVGKTDGFLYTDRLGQIWVLKDEHSWDAVETAITAGQIQNITTKITHPEFGNRIRIGSFSKNNDPNVSLSLEMDATYVACGEGVGAKAVVTFLDGSPVSDGYPVEWSSDNDNYAVWENAITHVYTHRITDEAREASSRYQVSTDYPIRQVHSVTEVQTGLTKTVKEFSGSTISLSEPLTYTNSGVIIDYETGYAINTLTAGTTGEVEVDVHAVVEVFVRDSATMRIDTAPGQEQDEEDRYVTVVVKDFMTEEEIASAAVALDGAAKGATGEGGSLDLGLIPGGEHSIRVTKTGYKPTSDPDDGLENDTIRIAKTTYVTTEEEETTDPNIITVHDDLANIKGDGTYHISYSQQQRLPPWGGNEDEVLILGPSGYPVSSGKSLAGKSDVGHTHEESDIIDLKNYLDLNNPSSLGSDWDIGNGRKIQGDKLQERSDEGGVEIVDTGNLGIKVAHGGVLTLDRALDTRSLFTRFESYDGWTEACTDTGSVPTKELAKMVLSTGVNNGSTAEMYITETPFVSVWDDSHFYGWICRYDTTPGNEEIYLLVTQDTGIATNKERAGFKIVDGRIWALSGNEIDEELTNTGYDLSKNQSIQLHILILEDNVFQFYLNNVLYATHEAYTLNGFNTRFVCYIKNTAAADARLRIMQAFYFHKWF